jgi:hypothetical protein
VACSAVAALLLSPGLLVGPSLDAAVFAEVAHRVRDGSTLYVGTWDHKPPGIYMLLAGLQFILPVLSPWLISWIVSVLATAGTATAIGIACRRIGVSVEASTVAAVASAVAMSQYLMSLGGGLTEPIAALPIAVATVLVVERERELVTRRAVTIGLLMALGLLLSIQVAVGCVALAWFVLARLEDRASRFAAARAIAFGALVPIMAVAAWLLLTNSLAAAVDALVGYSAAYRSLGFQIGSGLSGPVLTWTLLSLLFLIVPAGMGAISAVMRPANIRRLAAIACLGWIGLALVSFVIQGRLYAHYAIPLAIPLGLLAGMGIDRLDEVLSNTWKTSTRVMLVAPFAAAILLSLYAGFTSASMEWEPLQRDHARSVAVAALADQISQPGDRMWVWGNEPQVYLDAGRRSATPYPYLYPLATPGYASADLVAHTLQTLVADPPRLIVDAGSPAPGNAGFLHLIIPRPVASDGRDVDLLDPLRHFVERRYDYVDLADGWVVYELRDDAGSAGAPIGSLQLLLAATRR